MKIDVVLLSLAIILIWPPGCISDGGAYNSGFQPKHSIIVAIWKILDREASKAP